jgi:hypothetical protein
MISTSDSQKNSFSEHTRRGRFRKAALIWAAALLIGSLQPSRPASIHFGLAHHIVHLLAFGVLAFLATAGFGNPGRFSLSPAAASLLLGFAIEFIQHWQNRAPIEWHDVRDDAIGILAFTSFCHLVYRRRVDTGDSPLRVKESVP